MGKTEICAAQGHADILKLVAASQNPYLVIEDDVTWTAKNAGAMIRALIRALPKDWSIAFLDDVNHETHKLEQSPESEEMASPWARTLWSAYGIPAYLVSPAGAARLLEVLLPINTPVDVLYAYQAQYISAWMLRVPIATANWSLPSTIWQNGKAL
jgi:GR25 family glycosyltransferase involved in LPS biosynthesis